MRDAGFGTRRTMGQLCLSAAARERLPGVSVRRPTLPGNASRAASQPYASPSSAAEDRAALWYIEAQVYHVP